MKTRLISVIILVAILSVLLAPVCFAGGPGPNNVPIPQWVKDAQTKVKTATKRISPPTGNGVRLPSAPSAPLRGVQDGLVDVIKHNSK